MKWHPDELDPLFFPVLDRYLRNDFCKDVRKDDRIWKAFKKYSGLDDDEALAAIDFGKSTPYLIAEDLPGNGRFRKSKPDSVYLDTDVAFAFEDHPVRLKRVVQSTLLHEMVHWARHNDGNPRTKSGSYRGYEAGKRFECSAYGGDVSMNRETDRAKFKTRNLRGGARYKKFQCQTERRERK